MNEDIVQPTEVVTRACPSCGESIAAIPYDIGSGPELSCVNCEWCFGADGQPLQAQDHEKMIGIMFLPCKQCGKGIGVPWPHGKATGTCSEHSSG